MFTVSSRRLRVPRCFFDIHEDESAAHDAIIVRNEQQQPVLKVASNYGFQWLDT
jgi:hypothetical protein